MFNNTTTLPQRDDLASEANSLASSQDYNQKYSYLHSRFELKANNMTSPIIVEITAKTPLRKAWQALTDKQQMKEWYFDIPDFIPEVGTTFNFYEPGEERKYHHRCTILELEPEKRLVHTWTHPGHSKGVTTLKWELSPAELRSDNEIPSSEKFSETQHSTTAAVKIRLTHEGIENLSDAGPDFTRENYEAGWNEIVGELLKNFLEKE